LGLPKKSFDFKQKMACFGSHMHLGMYFCRNDVFVLESEASNDQNENGSWFPGFNAELIQDASIF